ncbi:mitochondrial ribosomal protein L27 precursor, putative [Plasmodium ovale]|uniref:Mitochondrial ribosomal protein L27, putative n=2 Tax=Plasmodium ovale TaxID=36330 RepID=A0A1A8WUA2_PLAOA|nr:mitochondrial ribosomal protein L27 precursor, putative [Plasmodium ovale curtisi]SBS95913.1 mitochondrial ribosomal protein L27 precursor, putative [Plasmodium ovale curtisi]SCP04230.1 mitochondrial ribosomal protein L27 precursor, putative [Plasmodium ovale]
MTIPFHIQKLLHLRNGLYHFVRNSTYQRGLTMYCEGKHVCFNPMSEVKKNVSPSSTIRCNVVHKRRIYSHSTHWFNNLHGVINLCGGLIVRPLCTKSGMGGSYGVSSHFGLFKMFKRSKMVKTSSYRRKSRSSPNGQGQKAKIGIKRLSGEYVRTGQLLVKQRKIIAFNYERKTRKRHFKYYPGEHVKVAKNTSLIALTNGRVKYTFHVLQNILIVNVVPEELDTLREEDLYRYRTEHVKSFEENRSLVYLRMKHTISFPKFKHTQYIKPPLKPQFLTKYDIYDNPTLQRVPVLYHKRP